MRSQGNSCLQGGITYFHEVGFQNKPQEQTLPFVMGSSIILRKMYYMLKLSQNRKKCFRDISCPVKCEQNLLFYSFYTTHLS